MGGLTDKENSTCFLHESRRRSLDSDRQVQHPSTIAGEPPLPPPDLTRSELLPFTPSPPRPARGRRSNAATEQMQKAAITKVFIEEKPALDMISIFSDRRSTMGKACLRRM
jgi:hypothetical protein